MIPINRSRKLLLPTLLDGDCLRFPDAVTERGRQHLGLLRAAVEQGGRGVMPYAVKGERFAPVWSVDPAYAEGLAAAAQAGVEVFAVRIRHTETGPEVAERLPVNLTRHVKPQGNGNH